MKDTIKINKGKTQMVAHRGLSGIETENTVAAYLAAANRSYYGIETDIHRTADGKFVCLHDADTRRVAGKRRTTAKSTDADLAGVHLKDYSCGHGARADLVPPMLEDYISICKTYGKHSILELKDEFTVAELKKIVRIIKRIGHLDDTTFITFIPQNVINFRSFMPDHPFQILVDRYDDYIAEGVKTYNLGVDILSTALTEDLVKLIKSRNIPLNCWTVDDPVAAERLVSWGVDYITTNILE